MLICGLSNKAMEKSKSFKDPTGWWLSEKLDGVRTLVKRSYSLSNEQALVQLYFEHVYDNTGFEEFGLLCVVTSPACKPWHPRSVHIGMARTSIRATA